MAELPGDVREAVLSAQLGEHIQSIGQKHGLHIDQVGALEDETMLVMLGFFAPETFSDQIATQLQIPAADAAAIAQEVNEQIFLPIRESMKAFADSKRQPIPAQETQESRIPIKISTEQEQNLPANSIPAVASQTVSQVIPQAPAPQGFAMGGTPATSEALSPVTVMPQQNQVTPPTAPSAPMKEAEQMLTEPTVAKPAEPATGPIYKADPYREPIE